MFQLFQLINANCASLLLFPLKAWNQIFVPHIVCIYMHISNPVTIAFLK